MGSNTREAGLCGEALESCIGAIRLRPSLGAAQCLRISGLGQVGPHARPRKLVGDELPPRGRLHGEGTVTPLEAAQPLAHLLDRRRSDLAAAHLTGLGVEVVEGDLLTMNVEPAYDCHGTSSRSR